MHQSIGDSRTSPAFRRTKGKEFLLRYRLPGVQYDVSFEGITITFFQTMKLVIDMDTPAAVTSITDTIFAQRGTMTFWCIAEDRIGFRFVFAPFRLPTAMRTESLIEYGICFQVIDKQSVESGMQTHINQDAEICIVSLLLAEGFCLGCLVFYAIASLLQGLSGEQDGKVEKEEGGNFHRQNSNRKE